MGGLRPQCMALSGTGRQFLTLVRYLPGRSILSQGRKAQTLTLYLRSPHSSRQPRFHVYLRITAA